MAAFAKSLKKGREIGRGADGVVYECEWNGKTVAVKKVSRSPLETSDESNRVDRSFQPAILKSLSHPHIVEILEITTLQEEGPVIVMERLDQNLRMYLELHSGKLSHERQIAMCIQIADAVHYLHSQQPPVVSRSLTSRNVLISQDGILKLCAATSVARLPPSGYFDELAPGAVVYMPPESLKRNAHYNEKIDVFSLGVLMLEIAIQQRPSRGLSGLGTVPGFGVVSEIGRRRHDLSRLPEDHPLKPIILQCLRDDPGERPDSGTVLRMLSEVCPMMQRAYQEALEKHGSVLVEVMPCVFVGSSAVGKSSLKHLLVHNTPKAVKTSTAVMETPEVVTISSEQYTVGGGTSAWQQISDDVMGKSLQACVNTRAYDESRYPELFQHQDGQHQQMEEEDNRPQQPAPLNVFQKFIKLCSRVFTNQSVSPQVESMEGLRTGPKLNSEVKSGCSCDDSEIVALLDKEHSIFLEETREGRESIKLNDASFIHLLDTGGQPSFQDALPLLLDTPCTYIQVFNAARDLDQPVPITYRPDDHTEEVLPLSAETGWEMMLRSFSSMQTMAHKCSKELASFQQEEGKLPQFRIFVVGTFKDQLMEKGNLEKATQDISKRMKELEGKPYYHCIKKDSTGQPFYLINNMAEKEEERACSNHLRAHLSTTQSSLKLKVPVVWYICVLITHFVPQKFISFRDLKAFCLKQRFIDRRGADEQFRSLLKLFSILGFYSFFDLKDVPDEANYICTDKGVFLKEVSKLLAVQFHRAPRHPAVEVFKQNGIISNNVEIFEELGITEEVDRSWLLATLEHVGLVARYASDPDHSPSYFMPLALPQGKTKLPDCSTMAPLCVTFTFPSPNNPLVYTDLPRGVFCRLAVELSNGPWKPIPKESDRTTVKFNSENFELYLTEAPGFISLTPVLVEELEGKEPLAELHKLCRQLYDTLRKSIIPSAEDVLGDQFSQTTEIVFGFECDCRKVPHLATPMSSEGKSLICQATQQRRGNLKNERIWFSPVNGTELVEVDGSNMWVMKETGGPSSDPPPTGHLRQKVHAQQSTACSKFDSRPAKEQDVTSLRIVDTPHFEKLLRKHVAQNVGQHGHSLLIHLGLSTEQSQMLHKDNPHDCASAIHGGLLKFKDRGGTWGKLIEEMKEAEIGLEYIEALKGELNSAH